MVHIALHCRLLITPQQPEIRSSFKYQRRCQVSPSPLLPSVLHANLSNLGFCKSTLTACLWRLPLGLSFQTTPPFADCRQLSEITALLSWIAAPTPNIPRRRPLIHLDQLPEEVKVEEQLQSPVRIEDDPPAGGSENRRSSRAAGPSVVKVGKGLRKPARPVSEEGGGDLRGPEEVNGRFNGEGQKKGSGSGSGSGSGGGKRTREARHRSGMSVTNSHLSGVERQLLEEFRSRAVEDALEEYKDRLTRFEISNVWAELQRCHDWERTLEMFAWIKRQPYYKPSVKVYNGLLGFFGRERQPDIAEKLFLEMFNHKDSAPNHYSYTAMIMAYGRAKMFATAREVFEHMKVTEEPNCRPNIVSCNALIGMYLKGGLYSKAMEVLEDMRESRNGLGPELKPNIVTYNTFVDTLCKDRQIQAAVDLMYDMEAGRLEVLPNEVTFNTLIDACGKAGMHTRAEQLYEMMVDNGFRPDEVTYTALMDAFGKANLTDKVHSTFEAMKAAGVKTDVFTYTVLVIAYGKDGLYERAEAVYQEMLSKRIRPTVVTYLALIDTYGKAGEVLKAERTFEDMRRSGILPNVHTYSALIDAYGKNGDYVRCVETFQKMQTGGCRPNLITLAVLLNAVCCSASLDSARAILSSLKGSGIDHWGQALRSLLLGGSSTDVTGIGEELLASIRREPQLWRQSFVNALVDALWTFGLEARAAAILKAAPRFDVYPEEARVYEKEVWELDLHDLSVGAAVISVLMWLEDLRQAWLWDESSPGVVKIVTGWGRHRRRGEARVKGAIYRRLSEMQSPLFEPEDNVGCVTAEGEAVRQWLLQPRIAASLRLVDRRDRQPITR